jgi:DNA polymerase-1
MKQGEIEVADVLALPPGLTEPPPMPDRDVVCVLDVSFFTFRAYHALPPLTTSQGLPTNAVHGVATMLERLFRTQTPRYAAAAFDSPGPTFRNDLYAAYKANREEPDVELKTQFPYVRRLVEAMSIRCLADPRYEADDILATLARELGESGKEVLIVTGDKDLMQCVTENVSLFDPIRGQKIREAEVIEKFGVPPSAVADVQGLMGDSTDNIPGIRGIGPKTAIRLIQHFGSLENVLERSDEIDKLDIRGAASVRKKVEESGEAARLSKKLATVDSHVELGVRLEDLTVGSLHTAALLVLAEELEMERFATRIREVLPDGAGVDSPLEGDTPEPKTPAESVLTATNMAGADWRDFAGSEVAVILTTDTLGRSVLGIAADDKRAIVIGDKEIRDALAGLAERGISLSGHDIKTLCREFGAQSGRAGVDLGVASYLYDPSAGSHDAADVTERFLGESVADPRGSANELDVALEQVCRLVPALRRALAEHEQEDLYRDLEHPLIECLAAMEARGISVDSAILHEISEDFRKRMESLVAGIYEAAGGEFNILSHTQLREILFEKLELPTKGIKRTKSGPSTDSDSLQDLAPLHPLPMLVLEYRGLAKLKSTYVEALRRLADKNGRVHTTFNQTVAATGRLSSTDPNLQNIPIRTEDGKRIRRAFVAPAGWQLISADYNQIELRVLADISRDPALIAAFEKGLDIHVSTAGEVFEVPETDVTSAMRRAAKVINYGIIYGMGPSRMARELSIDRKKASEYIDAYFARFAGVRRFYDEMRDKARRDGYVATRAGRRRYLPDIHSGHEGLRQAAERVATNTPIQGGAADIIKSAMLGVTSALRDARASAVMLLQIHDELLIEAPESELADSVALTRSCMERAATLAVPIVVDVGVGQNWAAAH